MEHINKIVNSITQNACSESCKREHQMWLATVSGNMLQWLHPYCLLQITLINNRWHMRSFDKRKWCHINYPGFACNKGDKRQYTTKWLAWKKRSRQQKPRTTTITCLHACTLTATVLPCNHQGKRYNIIQARQMFPEFKYALESNGRTGIV